MRYELTDHEWTAIKPMLPNKPRTRSVSKLMSAVVRIPRSGFELGARLDFGTRDWYTRQNWLARSY